MSPEPYAQVSNLVIPTATVISALAMVSHAMEWALGRAAVAKAVPAEQPEAVKAEVLVASSASASAAASTGSGSSGSDASVAQSTAGIEGASTERLEAASRIGLLLTWPACLLPPGGEGAPGW